ncbi:IS21 family transposase, partial [Staphylococcus pseudintermedius]
MLRKYRKNKKEKEIKKATIRVETRPGITTQTGKKI